VSFAQLVAGIASAGVVSALFPGPLNCSTRLGGGASIPQGLFIEMFLTAQLVIVVIMLAKVKHKSTYLAPVGIGLAFFVAELIGAFSHSLSLKVPGKLILIIYYCRHLLYRRIPESRSVVGTRRDQPQVSRVSLDLLGWTVAWLTSRVGVLRFAALCSLGEY
jgi:hypothetical protein